MLARRASGRPGGQNGAVTISPQPRPAALAASPGGFQVSRGLLYLGGFFASGVGLSALYAATGAGVPCLFRSLTGWNCPLCGGTRMGSALLHGDVVGAFWFNPLAFVGLALLGVLGVLWVVEALGGPAVRPPRPVASRLRRVRANQWLVAGLAVAVVYTVLRNL